MSVKDLWITERTGAEGRRRLHDWARMADFFNGLADRLAAHGMATGYHNHYTEFVRAEGSTPWDAFFRKTRTDAIMQMDVGNALRGGADIMAVLGRYPGRCRTIHLEPYSPAAGRDDPDAGFRPPIGEDGVPWTELLAFCRGKGKTEWYIVEYESSAFPTLEAVRRCLEGLEAMRS